MSKNIQNDHHLTLSQEQKHSKHPPNIHKPKVIHQQHSFWNYSYFSDAPKKCCSKNFSHQDQRPVHRKRAPSAMTRSPTLAPEGGCINLWQLPTKMEKSAPTNSSENKKKMENWHTLRLRVGPLFNLTLSFLLRELYVFLLQNWLHTSTRSTPTQWSRVRII